MLLKCSLKILLVLVPASSENGNGFYFLKLFCFIMKSGPFPAPFSGMWLLCNTDLHPLISACVAGGGMTALEIKSNWVDRNWDPEMGKESRQFQPFVRFHETNCVGFSDPLSFLWFFLSWCIKLLVENTLNRKPPGFDAILSVGSVCHLFLWCQLWDCHPISSATLVLSFVFLHVLSALIWFVLKWFLSLGRW